MKVLLKPILALVLSLGVATSTFAANEAALESKMVCVVLAAAYDDDDDQTVTTVFTTLMSAKKVAKALNAEVTVSDDPIFDDVFVFSLKSKEQEDYAIKLFDEEGAEVGHNGFIAEDGNNYKRVNVQSLKDGSYNFVITDKEGREYNKTITVARGQIKN